MQLPPPFHFEHGLGQFGCGDEDLGRMREQPRQHPLLMLAVQFRSQIVQRYHRPVAALQGSTTANLQTAQVVAANGDIQQREVRTGISDRLKVQIVDGLNEGDHLLIGPVDGSGG